MPCKAEWLQWSFLMDAVPVPQAQQLALTLGMGFLKALGGSVPSPTQSWRWGTQAWREMKNREKWKCWRLSFSKISPRLRAIFPLVLPADISFSSMHGKDARLFPSPSMLEWWSLFWAVSHSSRALPRSCRVCTIPPATQKLLFAITTLLHMCTQI